MYRLGDDGDPSDARSRGRLVVSLAICFPTCSSGPRFTSGG